MNEQAVLYAADIAKMRGISQNQALQWLAWIERKHGPRYVGRAGDGRKARLYTTYEALEDLTPIRRSAKRHDTQTLDEILKMLSSIAHRIQAVEKRLGIIHHGAPS